MKKIQETKLHAIPHFPAGSFEVHIGGHFRLGIICSPIWGSFPVWGSFAALYSTNLNTWVERGTVRIKCLAQGPNTMLHGQKIEKF